MYTLEEILRGVKKPREAVMEINATYNRRVNGCYYNPDGIDVFEEDWDNLVVLDACRYDVFAEVADLPGRLERRTSRGGGTVEWLHGNVRDRDLTDTVYVTANPQFYKHRDELDAEFHAVDHLWRREWDDDIHTVHPSSVTEAARDAADAYPHKRLLVHYNQPHTPYIGSYGRQLDIGEAGSDPSFVETFLDNVTHYGASRDQYRRAYRENLEVVLPHVEDLLEDLRGKTVVTSDHGEMLGERAAPVPIRYYSHRIGVHVDELVEVPWLEIEAAERREIRGEEAQDVDDAVDEAVVADRLRDLGYAE